ncbi:SGNH/GDSL hydrolase family protein [Kribbella sp. NPDC050124]|uniref:SGNH/GDSL hydrolase family protein n=1 Tax=Kribbella sp. NPDC050124 TaxID=3364114 RepID=UPI0037AA2034
MRIKTLANCLALVGVLAASTITPTASATTGRWTGTWSTAAQSPLAETWQGKNWSLDGFADESVRQVVRISAGGSKVRIRLSNRYGSTALRLAGATIARAGAGAAIVPGTVRPLTFGGTRSTTVPAGQDTVSDPTHLRANALDRLTITLYFATPTGPSTFHEAAAATTYRAAGDHRFDSEGGAFTDNSHSWYYLTGVDVSGGRARSAVIAFGDSITDGVSATKDADNRYPDQLAERLAAAGQPIGVLNSGIAGNRVLEDTDCCGESALSRFARDLGDHPEARTVIVMQGLNDLGFDPDVTSAQLIEAHRELIRAAHQHGRRIIGGTLTPMKGSMLDSPRGETVRDEVNRWIRDSAEYDAVVDFDAVLTDPADPDTLRAEYDAGDALHPNDAGFQAMAAAIDLADL